ncbi:igE-binding protein-like [Sorex araneus]|uniref:igE-binding protein-like n=1 Tax=Sorex araneus TaxID=42254 RepID=UPI002433E8FC|nr:igE-binding protein-like [Sorex araneus]
MPVSWWWGALFVLLIWICLLFCSCVFTMGTEATWKMVQNCLEDEACSIVVREGRQVLEKVQDSLSETERSEGLGARMKIPSNKEKGLPGGGKKLEGRGEINKEKGLPGGGKKLEGKGEINETNDPPAACAPRSASDEAGDLYPRRDVAAISLDLRHRPRHSPSEDSSLSSEEEDLLQRKAARYEATRYHPLESRARGERGSTRPSPSAPPPPPYHDPPLDKARPSRTSLFPDNLRRQMRLAFPVFEGDGDERVYAQVEFAQIKELAEAVRKYGTNANYTISLLDRLARDRMTPRDWQDVAKATLPNNGKFLEWKALWYDAAQDQARLNRNARDATQHAWTSDMLTGQGVHAENQINLPWGIYPQISLLAIKAWKGLSVKGETGNQLTKVIQGPQEPFSDFVARMTEVASRIFGDSDAATPLIEQLIFEQATQECRNAIAPRKAKGLQDWLKVCRKLGGPLSNAGLAAAILCSQRQRSSDPSWDRTCFNCGKRGHVKRDCRAPRATPSLCQCCKKGNHPADRCRSVRDNTGRLLPPLISEEPKNGRRGPWSQGLNKYGTRFVREAQEQQPSAESPNWTSVPPPPSP